MTPQNAVTARPRHVTRMDDITQRNQATQAIAAAAEGSAPQDPAASKMQIEDLNFWYGETHALRGISMEIPAHQVTAFIGPSGCGKSTLLRSMNRMNELIPNTRHEGHIRLDGESIFDNADPVELRRRVGMVFQKPNPFPKSIYQNIAWGARINGYKGDLDELVERSLRQAALWDEVKDRLKDSAYGLSGGQQQRLCIARALAIEPEVILMDEPTSALDPKSTLKVEELIRKLKENYTIVIVTHNMQQAARISDKTAFFLEGEVVEFEETHKVFNNPVDPRTEGYINGQFG